jgi:diacylglycerol kinase family enzyme
MTWVEWLSIIAVVLAAIAVGLTLQIRRVLRRRGVTLDPSVGAPGSDGTAAAGTEDAARTLVAFVANPIKPGVAELRDAAVQACAARYLPEPMWFETTVEDPGIGQTREAVARGAKLVVAIGGDGTVRAVAEGLIGTDVPMGLVPQGTGNLLARNLDLPLSDVDEMLKVALTGRDRRIDVGWLRVVRDEAGLGDDEAEVAPEATAPEATPPGPQTRRDHLFLVIAGVGFDAAMVADTDHDLKARVGWLAYFVSGIKHLHARRMRLQMSIDESPWHAIRVRSVLVGNCGRLPGGITLLPDALVDDGWLDIGVIDTRGGIVGWGTLFGEVALQRFGVRNQLPNRIGRIDHARARELSVRTRVAQDVQVDGDLIGAALEISARVEPLALSVRVSGR